LTGSGHQWRLIRVLKLLPETLPSGSKEMLIVRSVCGKPKIKLVSIETSLSVGVLVMGLVVGRKSRQTLAVAQTYPLSQGN
jgi:hypothetical protein